MNSNRLTETDRTEAFSDAFFSIAITILVLEFKLPEFEKGQLSEVIVVLWPSLIAFLFSFIYIGIIWLNHHALFSHIRFINRKVLWINFGILITTALLAFPTAVVAEAFRSGNNDDKGIAVSLYAVSAGLMSVSWVPVFEYFKKHPELLEDHSNPDFFKHQRIRPWIGVIFYALAAIIGRSFPLFGILVFLLMIIYHACTSEGIKRSKWTMPKAELRPNPLE